VTVVVKSCIEVSSKVLKKTDNMRIRRTNEEKIRKKEVGEGS
jgi:hypothetical protein